jgi:transcriptional regulator with XRE-family HTH domain
MPMLPKPLRMIVKLVNNRMRELRENLGLSTVEMAQKMGIAYTSYIALENMRRRPVGQRGKWLSAAVKAASFHGLLPEDLFPDVITAVENSIVERKLDETEVMAVLSEQTARLSLGPESTCMDADQIEVLHRAIKTLSPVQQFIIAQRFGLDGGEERLLADCGKDLNLSRERIRGLQETALGRLRKQFFLVDREYEIACQKNAVDIHERSLEKRKKAETERKAEQDAERQRSFVSAKASNLGREQFDHWKALATTLLESPQPPARVYRPKKRVRAYYEELYAAEMKLDPGLLDQLLFVEAAGYGQWVMMRVSPDLHGGRNILIVVKEADLHEEPIDETMEAKGWLKRLRLGQPIPISEKRRDHWWYGFSRYED